jgi:hypothetical protein
MLPNPLWLIADRPSILDRKKVLIWEFAGRILHSPATPWEVISLPAAATQEDIEGNFAVKNARETDDKCTER